MEQLGSQLIDSGEFIGFTGLSVPRRTLPFSPCVEVGWRLARGFWGKGFATEAASAALRFGFGQLSLAEIVSFTAKGNQRSRAVMERLGFTLLERIPFDNPLVADELWVHARTRV